jgi:nucleotide-binding universal stress UspA family protein
MSDFSVILIPTDLTERTIEAMTTALALTHGRTRLIVVHVIEGRRTLSDARRRAIENWLAEIRKHDPMIEVELVIRTGHAAEEILQAAEDAHCELIVISTHARTGLDRMMLGSVAEDVLRGAHCPVLCLKSADSGMVQAWPTKIGSFLEIN